MRHRPSLRAKPWPGLAFGAMRRRFFLAAGVAALLAAPPAQAQDVYTITTCRTADGRPASTSGWTQGGEAPITKIDSCREGGALSVGPALR